MKMSDAKAAVDKEWKKLETIPTLQLEKVKGKKEVILEAQGDKRKFHFAALLDACHLQYPTVLQNQKSFRWFALDLWDMVIVLRWTNSTKTPTNAASGKGCETGNCSRNHGSKPKQRETEMLINCQMWTTYPQTHILLKVSLSCTSLKTMRLWSRWSSKDEVQRWDTCPEPTELRLIGCSTESIWNQKSKSNMMKPKINSLTCWPKEFSWFAQH